MASSKHTIKVNSMNASQEESLAEKITKNVMEAIGADQGGNINIDVQISADGKEFEKELKKLQNSLEKLRSSSVIDFGGSRGLYNEINSVERELDDLRNSFADLSDTDQEAFYSMVNSLDESIEHFSEYNQAVRDFKQLYGDLKDVLSGKFSISSFSEFADDLNNAINTIESFGGSVADFGATDFTPVMTQFEKVAAEVENVSTELQNTISNLNNDIASGIDTSSLTSYEKTITRLQNKLGTLGVSDDNGAMREASNTLDFISTQIKNQSAEAADALKTNIEQAIKTVNSKKVSVKGLTELIDSLSKGKESVLSFGQSLEDVGITNFDSTLESLNNRLQEIVDIRNAMTDVEDSAKNYLDSENRDIATLEAYIDKITEYQGKLKSLGTSSRTGNGMIKSLQNAINNAGTVEIPVEAKISEETFARLPDTIKTAVKSVKLDTIDLSKQLTDSLNIDDVEIIDKVQMQLDLIATRLAESWNGEKLDLADTEWLDQALDDFVKQLMSGAQVVYKTGNEIYDDFVDFFNKNLILKTDALVDEVGVAKFNDYFTKYPGLFTTDASKGYDIVSNWEQMSQNWFQGILSYYDTDNNKLDQIINALNKSREESVKKISVSKMNEEDVLNMETTAWEETSQTFNKICTLLSERIQKETEVANEAQEALIATDNTVVEKTADTSALDSLTDTIKTRMQEIRDAMSSGAATSIDAWNYQGELSRLSKQLADAGGSAEQAQLDFEGLNHELADYYSQKKREEIDSIVNSGNDVEKIANSTEKAAQAANSEATAREKAADAAERQAEAYDKVIDRLDGDYQLTGYTTTKTDKTNNAIVRTRENYKIDQETMERSLSSVTIDTDYAAARKEAEKLAASIDKAETKLSRFNENTAGWFSGSKAYQDVEKAIQKLKDGEGTIEEVNSAMEKLNQADSNFATEVGNKKLNQYQSLANETKGLATSINDAQAAYDALLVKPEELGKKLIELKDQNTDLQNATDKSTSAWAQSFNDIKGGLSDVNSQIANYQKSNGSIFDLSALESSSLKYFQSITGSYEEAKDAISKIADANNWTTFNISQPTKDATGKIQQLTVTYQDATGAVEEFIMAQAKIATDGGKNVGTGLVQTGNIKVITTEDQYIQDQIAQWEAEEAELEAAAIKRAEAEQAAADKIAAAQQKAAQTEYIKWWSDTLSSLEKVQSSLSTYSKTSASQQNALSAFSGFDTDSLNEARKYAIGYEQIVNDLKAALDAETGEIDIGKLMDLGWDDSKIQNIGQTIKDLGNSYTEAMSKAKQEIGEVNEAYSQMTSIAKQMGNIEVKMVGLDSSSQEYQELSAQLELLKEEYDSLQDEFGAQLSTEQLQNLQNIANETADKLEVVKAKLKDTLTTKFDSSVEDNFQKISTQFDNIENKTEENITAMDNYKQAIADMQSAIASGDLDKMVSSYSNYEAALKEINVQLSQQKVLSDSSILSNNIQTWMNNNRAAAQAFGEELTQLQAKLNNNTDPIMLQDVKTRFKEIQAEAKAAGLATDSFGTSLKKTVAQALGIGSTVQVFRKVISAVEEAIDTIVDLDDALVDLQKTSDATATELNEFYNEANEIAKEYGATTEEIIQSAADWSRLGYDLEDSETMSQLSSMFSSISPGMDVDTATTGLVSIMKANKYICLYVQKCA